MIEYGVTKIGGTQLLGTIFSPGFAILVLGGIVIWKLLEDKREFQEIRTKMAENTETLGNLNTKLEFLSTQKFEQLGQITQSQKKHLAVPQKVKPSISKRNTINQTSKFTTESSSRSAIFKQIIEDNIELRKAII
jgi:hypothetical protein